MFEYSLEKENERREVTIGYMAHADLYMITKDNREWHKEEKEKSITKMIREYLSIFFKYMDKSPKTFAMYGDDVYISFDNIDSSEREYIVFKKIRSIIDNIFSVENILS